MDNIIIKNLKSNSMVPESDFGSLGLNLHDRDILFITGQNMKYEELKDQILTKSLRLKWLKTDTKEIQHYNPMEIVQEKCLEARRNINSEEIILVEDVSLNFKGMNDLPGPYIKWFLDQLQPEGLVKMLQGFENKSAEAVCIYALLCGEYLVFCRGVAYGRIVEPRGNTGWGWDSIFEERKSGLTYSEMGEELKRKHSHRAKAIISLNQFLSKFANPER